MNIELHHLLNSSDFKNSGLWHYREVKTGEVVFRKGEKSCDIYLIMSGRVRVIGELDLDRQRHVKPGVCELGDGDVFGELAMFDHEPRSATVMAIADCKFAVIDGEGFMSYLDDHPDIGLIVFKSLLHVLVGRLRKADKRIFFLFSWGLKAYGIDNHL